MANLKYEWLLFDADGTLFDYNKAEQTALKNTFNEAGIEYQPGYLEIYKTVNSRLWKGLEKGTVDKSVVKTKRFSDLLGLLNLEGDPDILSNNYLKNLSMSSLLLNDAAEICMKLSVNYKLALITNGFKEVQRPRFEASGIRKYFSEMVISDEIGAAKPDSKYFDIAFEMIGNPSKSNVLVIGDSLSSDITGGINYGLDTCWLNPDNIPADSIKGIKYEIQSLDELLLFL